MPRTSRGSRMHCDRVAGSHERCGVRSAEARRIGAAVASLIPGSVATTVLPWVERLVSKPTRDIDTRERGSVLPRDLRGARTYGCTEGKARAVLRGVAGPHLKSIAGAG